MGRRRFKLEQITHMLRGRDQAGWWQDDGRGPPGAGTAAIDKPRGEFFHTNWTGRDGTTASSTYAV